MTNKGVISEWIILKSILTLYNLISSIMLYSTEIWVSNIPQLLSLKLHKLDTTNFFSAHHFQTIKEGPDSTTMIGPSLSFTVVVRMFSWTFIILTLCKNSRDYGSWTIKNLTFGNYFYEISTLYTYIREREGERGDRKLKKVV